MPMVFCASLPPCPRLYIDAENNCPRRNHLSILPGVERTNTQDTSTIISAPRTNPSSGDKTMNRMILISPPAISEPVPALATAAPTRTPINACEEEDGMPKRQV